MGGVAGKIRDNFRHNWYFSCFLQTKILFEKVFGGGGVVVGTSEGEGMVEAEALTRRALSLPHPSEMPAPFPRPSFLCSLRATVQECRPCGFSVLCSMTIAGVGRNRKIAAWMT